MVDHRLSLVLSSSPSLVVLRRMGLDTSYWRVSVDCLGELLNELSKVVSVAVPGLQVTSLHHILLSS